MTCSNFGREIKCPTVKSEHYRHQWERSLDDYVNGFPLEKAFNWEHLLSNDTTVVQSVLLPCRRLNDVTYKHQKNIFLDKLASVIPNSHSRNILTNFYLQMCSVLQDDSEKLVTLVKFYPSAATAINVFLRKHFLNYFHDYPNKGENESEIIVWARSYLMYLFELKDLYLASSTLDWMSQFRYRAVHEFLLSTASNQVPKLSKPEYWLFMYKLLGIVVPGPPPSLISSNRYASVLFSIGAAVSSGCPLSPEHFVLMGNRLVYDIEPKPLLYNNISLTPGLVGLAAYIMMRYPTPSILPFIKNVVNIRQGSSIHLFGCFIYPLAILGQINDNAVKEEVMSIITQILNMKHCPNDQRDYISQDDYSEKCIKSQSTLISLKLGQVLSNIVEKGLDLVTKQLQKSTLTTFSATVLCHCIVVSDDRPSDLLLSTFRLADDSTNMPILLFIMIHIRLIYERKVKQSLKFVYLYMKNFRLLLKKASSSIVKKMVKMMFSDVGPFTMENDDVINASYKIMYDIWDDHGDLVHDTFYSMLSKPGLRGPGLDLTIMSIIRRMCSSDRPVDMDEMGKIVFKYLETSKNDQVIGKCIDSLTYLCLAGMDFRQIQHIILRFVENPKLSVNVCFFFSKFLLEFPPQEQMDRIIKILWSFTHSPSDTEASAIAYEGLLKSEIEFNLTDEIERNIIALFKRREQPLYSADLVASIITRELREHPAQAVGVIPNPSKKLLSDFRVKDIMASKNLTHDLFSFSGVGSTTNRQQYKKQLHQNERILSKILGKFSENEFLDPFDGIIIIEGWNHFMFEYINSIYTMPSYNFHHRNRKDSITPAVLLQQIKEDVYKVVEQQLNTENTAKMYLRALVITSIANAVYKIALQNNMLDGHISSLIAKDIGILRTLIIYDKDSSANSSKTKAIMLLSSAYMAKIAGDMEDESMLSMLLMASTESVPPKSNLTDLVSQCASIATGAIVHVYYKIKPQTGQIKEAIQKMLDSQHYLGLSFCVDSFCNSIEKSVTRELINNFASDCSSDNTVMMDRTMFIGLLLAYSYHVDNINDQELLEFLAYVNRCIDMTDNPLEQKYLLISQGLIYHCILNWQYCIPTWRDSYRVTVQDYVSKFSDGIDNMLLPTLALLIGFPVTNLADYFNWGPSIDGVAVYSEHVTKANLSENTRLCSLMIARKFEESKQSLISYKTLPGSAWEIVSDMIHKSLVKQTPESKQKLSFALNILSKVDAKIPLSNPIQILIAIFTRTSLQQEVIHFAGQQAKHSSFRYYEFIEKFLSLSVFPQLSDQCQVEIIKQLPNYIQFVEERKLPTLLNNFLSKTFWSRNDELRQRILFVYESLLREQPDMKEQIRSVLVSNYFTSPKLHLLSPEIVSQIGSLMKSVDFYQLGLNHLVAESELVVDFIKTNHHAKEVVKMYFTRYLQAELYTTELLRAVVNIVVALDKDTAYKNLYSVMTQIKKSLEERPENFMNPAIACINTVVLTYIAYLKQEQSIGNGLENFVYLSEIVEPQVNVDCLAVVLKNLDPWSRINSLYIAVLPNDS